MAYASWSVVFGEQPSAAKWNILGTNDAYFDGLVGSGTAWASWTPTFGNLSGGTLNYSVYQQIGNNVFFRLKYTLGGAGVAGSVSFTAPVTAVAGIASDTITSVCTYTDATDGLDRVGGCDFFDVNTIALRATRADGTYASYAALAAGVPFTWANNDVIICSGIYEAA